MSDFTDVLIDGPQPVKRVPYWRSRFEEQQALVRKKNRELGSLRAENARLRVLLNRGVVLMPLWFSRGWIAEAQAALAGEEVPGE